MDLLSLSGDLGTPVRATVSSFGPLLLARILDLNTTQTSVLSLVFKYCDDQGLPLLDLADLRTTTRSDGTVVGRREALPYFVEVKGVAGRIDRGLKLDSREAGVPACSPRRSSAVATSADAAPPNPLSSPPIWGIPVMEVRCASAVPRSDPAARPAITGGQSTTRRSRS